METVRDKRMTRRTPRSEKLGGKYDLKSYGSALSCTPSQQQESTQLSQHLKKMWYSAGF